MGYAIAGTHDRLRNHRPVRTTLTGFLVLLSTSLIFSMLPDIDSVIGILAGDIGRYHNNLTHSLFFGLFVVLLFAVIGRFWWSPVLTWFMVALAAYEMHVLMDFATAGRGVMLFWPLTQERFSAPVQLFYGFHWSDGLFSVRHLWTLLTESIFAVIVVLIVNVLWPRLVVSNQRSSSADI